MKENYGFSHILFQYLISNISLFHYYYFFHQENDFLYCVHCTVHCTLLQYTNNIFLFIIIFLLSLDITTVQYCTVYCINAYFIRFEMLKDIFVINNLKWYQIQHQMIFIESRSDLRQLKTRIFLFCYLHPFFPCM